MQRTTEQSTFCTSVDKRSAEWTYRCIELIKFTLCNLDNILFVNQLQIAIFQEGGALGHSPIQNRRN